MRPPLTDSEFAIAVAWLTLERALEILPHSTLQSIQAGGQGAGEAYDWLFTFHGRDRCGKRYIWPAEGGDFSTKLVHRQVNVKGNQRPPRFGSVGSVAPGRSESR